MNPSNNINHILEDEVTMIHWNPQPPDLNDAYWKAKERIIETEKSVLRWLTLGCFVSHPRPAVLLIVEHLLLSSNTRNASCNTLDEQQFI
jgi:hypothetical protein